MKEKKETNKERGHRWKRKMREMIDSRIKKERRRENGAERGRE